MRKEGRETEREGEQYEKGGQRDRERGREIQLVVSNGIPPLTETVILQTMVSGKGPPIFFNSLSRQVAISSMNTHTSVCRAEAQSMFIPTTPDS